MNKPWVECQNKIQILKRSMAVFKYTDCGTYFLGSNSGCASLGQVPQPVWASYLWNGDTNKTLISPGCGDEYMH